MDGGLGHRRSVHAARDHLDPIGSPQGAVSFVTNFDSCAEVLSQVRGVYFPGR